VKRAWRALLAAFAAAALAGCRQDMNVQPKLLANGPARGAWTQGADRPLIAGTIARGDLKRDADGIIVKRGFPKPPSYYSPALLAASSQHIFDVITRGWGVMYPYSARVAPRDRWAIVAYIRALQLTRNPQFAASGKTGGAP